MACLAGSAGAGVSSAPSRGPVLAQAPKHLPQVDAMAQRRDQVVASIANALIVQTIARISSRAPLVAPLSLAWARAASD